MRLGGCELKQLMVTTWVECPCVKYPVTCAEALGLYLDADVLSSAGNSLVSNIACLRM